MGELINRFTYAVWYRNLLTWKRLFWPSMATNVANPLIFLFAFGFGLGAIIETVDGVSYLAFVVPGMMAYSAMFAASFESSISAYARFNMQKTWDAILSSPVSLVELLTGELLWCASKAMLAAMTVLIVGWIWGGVLSVPGAIISIPLLFVTALCFASCGLLATAYANSWDMFSYFFTFWVTPMFMFSGTFFATDRFPEFIQWLAWILPMTHLIEVIRPLLTGAELVPILALLHMLYIVLLTIITFWLAHRKLSLRLFD